MSRGAPPVLLLGGYRQAPAVARSLGRAGYRVVVGVGPHGNPAARSRYAQERWTHRHVSDPAFVGDLLGFAEKHPRLAVFPLGDGELLALADADLPPTLVPVMPASATVRTCLDKSGAQELMASVGVTPPKTTLVRSLDSLGSAVATVGLPAVIKPDTSLATIAGNKALICRSVREAESSIREWPAGASYLLVQEYFRGQRHNCHLVSEGGAITARFEQVIVRTDRLDATGLCVEARSGPPTEALWELCGSITQGVEYTGAACIQFLINEEGQVRCLEINPRMCASCAFPVHCGVDMPLATLRAVLRSHGWVDEVAVPGPSEYRTGQTLNWLLGDIGGVIEERGALAGRERFRALGRVVASAARADVHVTWSWRDPMPTLVMLYALIRRLASGLGRKLRP